MAMLISETVLIKASSDMFNRLLIIGKSRDIDLEELLSYALTPVPMSLGTTDGTPCKTVKAKLMHELEKDVEPLAQVPAGSALIVDGMAFIHQIHTMPSTFSQLADRRLQDPMHMAIQCRCLRVDFVCDQYPVHRLKNSEREMWQSGHPHHKTRPENTKAIQEISGKWEKLRITDRVPFSVLDYARSWNTEQRLVGSITR